MFELVECVKPSGNHGIGYAGVLLQLFVEECQLFLFGSLVDTGYVEIYFIPEKILNEKCLAYSSPSVYGYKFCFIRFVAVFKCCTFLSPSDDF